MFTAEGAEDAEERDDVMPNTNPTRKRGNVQHSTLVALTRPIGAASHVPSLARRVSIVRRRRVAKICSPFFNRFFLCVLRAPAVNTLNRTTTFPMSRRLLPTLADYVVIAINPALIMGLIGSLVYFLLEVFYAGQYPERLQFCPVGVRLRHRAGFADRDGKRFSARRPVRHGAGRGRRLALNSLCRLSRHGRRSFRLGHQLGADGPDLVVRPQADLGLHRDRRKRRSRRPRAVGNRRARSGEAGVSDRRSRPSRSTDKPSRGGAGQRSGRTRWQQFARSARAAAHAGSLDRLFFAGLAADFWLRPGLYPARRTSPAGATRSSCCASMSPAAWPCC